MEVKQFDLVSGVKTCPLKYNLEKKLLVKRTILSWLKTLPKLEKDA